MLRLANEFLEVTVIDPSSDRELLGPRYCSGCSVWQLSTRSGKALLAGPEFPALPSVINGQGAPEVFQHTLFHEAEETPETKLIIGVGLLENHLRLRNADSHWGLHLVEPCRWTVRQNQNALRMQTSQHDESWHLQLDRTLQLDGRALTSTTLLRNTGKIPLPVRWFAHPFFPFDPGLRLHCEKLRGTIPPNPAFSPLQDGSVGLAKDYPWSEGFFLDLPSHAGAPFLARIHAPGSGSVNVESAFPLLKLALWANDRTFSVEPFFGGEIAPGSSREWSLLYTFEGIEKR